MALIRGMQKWIVTAGVLAVCLLLIRPAGHMIFAVRIGLSLQKLAAGTADQNPPVKEATIHRRFGAQNIKALSYRPAKSSAKSALILVPGISELGCYHPRLITLSKILAGAGIFVVTPDIREFRSFEITAEPVGQILFWLRETSALEGGEKIQKTGLAGISFSATLAMIAAAKPEVRDNIGFFVGIGAYSDLGRCTQGWFATDPSIVPNNYYPTRFYAKWIVMRAALDMLDSEKDRLFLRGVIDSLLLQKPVPSPPPDLTPEGARWYNLAIMQENRTDAELVEEIEQHLTLRIYPQLDPSDAVINLRCPVFLIHGAYDDLVPPEESMELHRRISRSYLLVSPFLTHTHPTDRRLTTWQKARAALDTTVFCYHLSRAIQ